jgi:hypothetical protein
LDARDEKDPKGLQNLWGLLLDFAGNFSVERVNNPFYIYYFKKSRPTAGAAQQGLGFYPSLNGYLYLRTEWPPPVPQGQQHIDLTSQPK